MTTQLKVHGASAILQTEGEDVKGIDCAAGPACSVWCFRSKLHMEEPAAAARSWVLHSLCMTQSTSYQGRPTLWPSSVRCRRRRE